MEELLNEKCELHIDIENEIIKINGKFTIDTLEEVADRLKEVQEKLYYKYLNNLKDELYNEDLDLTRSLNRQ